MKRKRKRWSEEELDKMAADYARLKSLKKVARIYGRHFVTIHGLLKRHLRISPASRELPERTVAAIVATYRLTNSCTETARRWKRTRQSIWDILHRRGLTNPNDIHLNRRKAGVVYKGERFTPDHQGFLRSTRYATRKRGGHRMLHHVIWEEHHGPVPDGSMVMFKDGNRGNCAIENLVMKTRREARAGQKSMNGWTKYNIRKAELFEAWQKSLATGKPAEIAAARLAYDTLPNPDSHSPERRRNWAEMMRRKWASYTPEERQARIDKSLRGRYGEALIR